MASVAPSVTRIRPLDALRGVAASAVVLLHFNVALGQHWPNAVQHAIYVLLGRLPVTIFFALSGYVLALPFFSGSSSSPPAFLVKRILRIYVPYVAVAAVASVLIGPFTNASALPTLLMSGTHAGVALNPPFWSLVVEMRFSLIFPLLIALVRRAWVTAGLSAICIALLSAWLMPHMSSAPLQPTEGFTVASSFVVTAYYAPLFLGGILLARHRLAVRGIALRHNAILWILTGVLICCGFFSDLTLLAAPLLIVALVPYSEGVVAAFKNSAIVWLGKVSYSFYLLHGVVLVSIWHYTQSRAIAAATFIPISLLAAEMCYRTTEVPSIRLGAALASSIDALRSDRRAKVPGA